MQVGINEVVQRAEEIMNRDDFFPNHKDAVKVYTWAVFHAIKELAAENGSVWIRGFGKFYKTKPKKRYVGFLKKEIEVPARIKVKPSRALIIGG